MLSSTARLSTTSIPSRGQITNERIAQARSRLGFHTTYISSLQNTNTKHTTDSYAKEVDVSPPSSSKTYEVAAAGSASRPNERLEASASPSPSSSPSSSSKDNSNKGVHTADSYFKEIDTSPPSSSKTYEVENTGSATRPNEQFSDPSRDHSKPKATEHAKEHAYGTMSNEHPYEAPVEKDNGEKGEQKEQRLQYGGMKKDAEKDTPHKEQGPDAGDAGGRGGQR